VSEWGEEGKVFGVTATALQKRVSGLAADLVVFSYPLSLQLSSQRGMGREVELFQVPTTSTEGIRG